MRAIDIHAHAMPMPVLEWLEGEGLADLSEVDRSATSGVIRLDPRISGVAAGTPLPLARSQWDVPTRLREMDAAGVTHHAVSLPPFLFASTCEDMVLVAEVVRRGNDALAGYVAEAPGRLVGLGTAPVGLQSVAEEAGRCFGLGMPGVAIGTRGAGRELDDAVNEPLWALLAERRRLAFLHPSGVPDMHRLKDFYLPQLLGYPMETAIAVTRLIFAGVRQRNPFPLCLAHGGGCLPWMRGRLDLGWDRKEVAHTTPLPPSDYVRDLFFDTAVFSNEVLADLVRDLGVDRLVVGTDFPFDLADREPLVTVAELGLSEPEAEDVRWRTAARLLGLTEGEVQGS
jgi:aminocarboxymuconate-semialdehyde decarboxylase